MLFKKLFSKKQKENTLLKEMQDLSISFDTETNSYIIVVNNERRKVKVLKAKDDKVILKTCYKTSGRPKKEEN